MQTLQIPVDKSSALMTYLKVLNPFMSLTDMELKVLELFIILGDFSGDSRLRVCKQLNFKSASGVNNYIKSLKDKKILVEKAGVYHVHERISFDPEGITFAFTYAG